MTLSDGRSTNSIAEPPSGRWARDILVNVTANLIAAAIIYLLGVAAGLLPSEPRALLIAVMFVTFTLALLAYAAAKAYGRSKNPQKSDMSLMLLGIAIIMLGSTAILSAIPSDLLDWWERIGYAIVGLLAVLMGGMCIWVVRVMRKN